MRNLLFIRKHINLLIFSLTVSLISTSVYCAADNTAPEPDKKSIPEVLKSDIKSQPDKVTTTAVDESSSKSQSEARRNPSSLDNQSNTMNEPHRADDQLPFGGRRDEEDGNIDQEINPQEVSETQNDIERGSLSYSEPKSIMEMYQNFEKGSEHIIVPELIIDGDCGQKANDYKKIDCLLDEVDKIDDFLAILSSDKIELESLNFSDKSDKVAKARQLIDLTVPNNLPELLMSSIRPISQSTLTKYMLNRNLPAMANEIVANNFKEYEQYLLNKILDAYYRELIVAYSSNLTLNEIDELIKTQKEVNTIISTLAYEKLKKLIQLTIQNPNYLDNIVKEQSSLHQSAGDRFVENANQSLKDAGFSTIVISQ